MRRFLLPLGIIIAAVGLAVTPAAAANPEVNHFAFTESSTDPDFCGLGKTVNISADVHGTEFLAPNQPVDYRSAVEGTLTLTNPTNGNTVINHFAQTFSAATISGDPQGIHTDEFSYKGLPELFRTEHGGVLLRDAGYIVFHVTFNRDEAISIEIVLDRGPHPDAESDGALFCQVLPQALGLN